VVSGDNTAASNLGGQNQINPGADGNAGGNTPAGSLAAAAPGAPGAAAGSGVGSAGGTSPAKDDSSTTQKDSSQGKAAVGSYSGDGPGMGYASKPSYAPGVGMDSNFADLLKGMLPSDKDAKKEQGNLSFRDPASQSANAVIPRNENIFKHISDRTAKKLQEGAIVF
jgi:hypothetical protein